MKQKFQSHSRRFVAFVAASADGRISLTSKTLPDWTSKEDQRFFRRALAGFEAFVVGRNTYQAAAANLRKRNTFVFSSQLGRMQKRGTVTFVNPSSVNLVELFRNYQSVAILGGGMVYQAMLEKGLMDEIFVTVEPLVFGRGRAMFVGGRRTIGLRLLSAKRLNQKGTMLLHYQIDRQN